MTITGTNFNTTSAVKFNGLAAASFTVVNNTTITATPAAPTTTGTISVTKGGNTVVSVLSFTVNTAGAITPYLNVNNGGWNNVSTASLCSGGYVEYGPQPGNGVWSWTGPNGFKSFQRDSTITNLQIINSGTYTATYMNPNGCSTTQNFTISITATPSTTIASSGPTTFCSGGSVVLTAPLATSYQWSATAGSVTTASISINASGTYSVTASNGTCTAIASKVVTVNPTPTANISPVGPSTFCGSGALTASGGGTYLWNATGSSATTAAISATATGTYVVTVTNASGCTATASNAVTVNAAATASISAGGATTFCSGGNVRLTASGGGTYLWNATGGSATTAAITATTSGTYAVTVTSASGCTATASQVVTVNSPGTITPNLYTAATGWQSVTSATLCAGAFLEFGPQSSVSGGVWTISGPGGFYSYARDTGIYVANAGTYIETYYNPNGCNVIQNFTIILTHPDTLGVASNTNVCLGNNISLSSTVTGGTSYSYRWSGPNSFSSTSANPNLLATSSANDGTYSLTVTDNNHCTVSNSVTLVTNPNCVDSTTVGINGGNSSDAPCTQVLRFDHYNDVLASSASGQNHQWVLKNGNTLTMTVKRLGGAFTSVVAPTWSGAAFGQSGYSGLSGNTALYTNSSGYSKLSFSNIQVKDSLGNPIPNFTLIGIDAESTDGAERDTLTSNGSTWFDYDTITPPGVNSVPSEMGAGTSTLIWTGTGAANARARLVSTNNPSNFTFSTVAGGLQAFAMALSNPIQAKDSVKMCSSSVFDNTPTNLPSGTTYVWAAPIISPLGSVTGASAQSTPATLVGQTLVNTTTSIAYVQYTVLPSNNCSGIGYSFTVVVKPSPRSTLKALSPVCLGTALTASDTAISGGPLTYSWSGPGAFTATGSSISRASATIAMGGVYRVTVTAANGCTISQSQNISVVNCVNVSGTLFDDANGNGIQDAADTSTNRGQAMYAIITDSNNIVRGTALIDSNGNYTVTKIPVSMVGLRLTVSTASYTVGDSSVGPLWPNKWIGTLGQYGTHNLAGAGTTTTQQMIPISTDTFNITGLKLGYDRLPTSATNTYNITYPRNNTVMALLSSNNLGLLSATDPEDGSIGSGKKFTITSTAGLNGNQLYYDANGDGKADSNELIIAGTTITNYSTAKLLIKFSGLGSTSASFRFAATDAAGQIDPTPAAYTIRWIGALPVKMLYFTADKKNNDQSLLKWATASEIDNDNFEIEHSPDAQSWGKIGEVKGNGTTSDQQEYSFIDEHPLTAENYYRLKQVDVDGHYEYTEIVEVTFAEITTPPSISIYPNPLNQNNKLNIEVSGAETISEIIITNIEGQIVYTSPLPQVTRSQIADLNLPSGIYIVTARTQAEHLLTSRLIINQ